MRVEEFKVRCPMDNTLHDALAQISYAGGDKFVAFTECHKSQECKTCEECKFWMRKKYDAGELVMGVMEKPL